MTITEAELASLTYGCELEYEGISQERAAKVVAEVTGGTARYEGYHLSNWVVTMPDGRKWNIVSDGSLWGTSAEVVTPIMRYSDMDTLQKVVRAMRKARAKVNSRTGLHVHVGAQGMTPTQIKNLVKIFYKQETLILKATGTQEARISSYTRRTDHTFVDKICAMHNPTMAKLADAYYAGCRDRNSHYSSARYRALNLHNLWNGTKGTVEFRYHEQSLHAGVIRAAVLIDLLMVLKAKSAKAASAKNPRPYSEASAKYDFRVFLLRLGANGATFKSMRKHLCKNLPGSAAWKDGRHDYRRTPRLPREGRRGNADAKRERSETMKISTERKYPIENWEAFERSFATSPDTFLYFAYGSNLNPEQIRRRIPEARAVGRATLKGWRLVERLYADIERSRGSRVEGVLYLVTKTELHRLDLYEGYPNIYNCFKVIVHAELMGSRAIRYRVPAFTYAMTPETRKRRDGTPYPDGYRITCATGARYWGLPNAFGALKPIEKRRWVEKK